jgi:hypothetical protein
VLTPSAAILLHVPKSWRKRKRRCGIKEETPP